MNMNNDKFINELEKLEKSIKDYKEKDQSNTKEFRDSLSKTLTEILNYNEGISDKDCKRILDEAILQKFKDRKSRMPLADIRRIYEFSRDSFGNYNFNYEKPFDVVSGMYFNKEKDTFELYPFRVVSVDKENRIIDLLGLKLLGTGTWEKVKDLKFRFIFKDTFGFIVATGQIPDRDRLLIDISEEYTKHGGDSMGNDGAMLIGLGGSTYWAKTSKEYIPSYVASNGYSFYPDNSASVSLGVLPYVIIDKYWVLNEHKYNIW